MADKNDGVLAVLDYEIARYRRNYNDAGSPLDQLVQSRAKVAELLAAAESLEHGVSAKKMIRLYHATLAMRGDA